MKNFKAIEDIRINIDKIDIEILNLIEKRKNLVDRVVKLKTKDEIVDQKRIDSILKKLDEEAKNCLLYTSPSPRDRSSSRMPSSA